MLCQSSASIQDFPVPHMYSTYSPIIVQALHHTVCILILFKLASFLLRLDSWLPCSLLRCVSAHFSLALEQLGQSKHWTPPYAGSQKSPNSQLPV